MLAALLEVPCGESAPVPVIRLAKAVSHLKQARIRVRKTGPPESLAQREQELKQLESRR